jgi:hypothetical protein
MDYEERNENEDNPTNREIAQWQKEHEVWVKSQLHHHLANAYLNEYESFLIRFKLS